MRTLRWALRTSPGARATSWREDLALRRRRLLRKVYWTLGGASLLLGAAGVLLPVLPTVPFIILAAYCFGRSDPRIERWLLQHPHFGSAIRQWRERGAISRKGKIAATLAFLMSVALAVVLAPLPWALIPVAAAVGAGGWIWSRPDA